MKKIIFVFIALCINICTNAQSVVIKLANGEEVRCYYHNIQKILISSTSNSESTSIQGIPIWQYMGKKLVSAQKYKELSIALKSDLSLEANDCSGFLDNIKVTEGSPQTIEIRYFSDESEYEEDVLEDISLSESILMIVGETQTLTPIFTPEEAICNVSWSSENEEVATVDENGVVTAVGKGTTTIYCVSDDAEHVAFCQVRVLEVGDVNGDDRVSISDVSVLRNYLLGNNPAKYNGKAADIDGNGRVSISDVGKLINRLLNNN